MSHGDYGLKRVSYEINEHAPWMLVGALTDINRIVQRSSQQRYAASLATRVKTYSTLFAQVIFLLPGNYILKQ
jgi:hypothetical protein